MSNSVSPPAKPGDYLFYLCTVPFCSRSHNSENLLLYYFFRGPIMRLLYSLSSDLRSAAPQPLSPRPIHRTKGPHSLPVARYAFPDGVRRVCSYPMVPLGHFEGFLLCLPFTSFRDAMWVKFKPCRGPVLQGLCVRLGGRNFRPGAPCPEDRA